MNKKLRRHWLVVVNRPYEGLEMEEDSRVYATKVAAERVAAKMKHGDVISVMVPR
jgi:hypothetical protein